MGPDSRACSPLGIVQTCLNIRYWYPKFHDVPSKNNYITPLSGEYSIYSWDPSFFLRFPDPFEVISFLLFVAVLSVRVTYFHWSCYFSRILVHPKMPTKRLRT